MIFTTTSVAFIILSIGFLIFGWMFLRAFKKTESSPSDRKIGKLLSAYFIGFAINTGIILGLGTIVFIESPTGLFSVLIAFTAGLVCLSVLGIYTISYIFFPDNSPALPAGFAGVLGTITLIITFVARPEPFMVGGGMNWNIPFWVAMPFFYLVFISIGSSGYIFTRLFLKAKTMEMKILSFFPAMAGILGAISPFIIHVIFNSVHETTRIYATDISLALLGIGLMLCALALFFLRNKEASTKVMSGVAIVLFVLLTIWWMSINPLVNSPENYNARSFWSHTYPILTLWGAICALLVSLSWGFQGYMGKAILFFTIGLFLQLFGFTSYSYYFIFINDNVPYPGVGDIGFFGSIPFYILGALYLGKASGIRLKGSSIFDKVISIGVPSVILGISYIVFLKDYVFDWSSPIRIFLDFGYSLGETAYVSLAILIFLLSRKTLSGIIKWPVLFIVFALVMQYIADYGFTYQFNKGTWYIAGLNDFSYFFSSFVMTLALASVGRAFIKMQEIQEDAILDK